MTLPITHDVIERIYAGWLAKIIGIRYGVPIEGWTYERIRETYGELDGYFVDYRRFAADDDSNVPLFLLRALEHVLEQRGRAAAQAIEPQDIAEALLNYAPYEHGFFWWGGYGISTEHTAYLNLRHGIPAPRSGSIAQNGAAVAEQIGGQIFIDTWGLVAPGQPDLAARLGAAAASVTHGGDGIHGGIFVAVCVSAAFVERDMHRLIETGLSYIPEDCEYTRVVRAVMAFYDEHPDDWHACYHYIYEHFGYDRYPGACHIIPNIAVMILSLLYGEGDFDRTINICNMCGWDTDCNVGNVGAIMGVRNGLGAIDYDKWRRPINDFLVCSSVIGSLNIMDLPYGAAYIADLAAKLAGTSLPAPWDAIVGERIHSAHFELPGSTHGIEARIEGGEAEAEGRIALANSEETAATGTRSLRLAARTLQRGESICLYRGSYYVPADFDDSRYDPSFSPLCYPGQRIHGSVYIPAGAPALSAALYARDARSGERIRSEAVALDAAHWSALTLELPRLEAGLIDEVGYVLTAQDEAAVLEDVVVHIDDLYWEGGPDYSIDFARETLERWTYNRAEVSQFTRLKGLLYLDEGQLHLSCADYGEAYTGRYDWTDLTARFEITPRLGDWQLVNIRVQGAIRSYAAGLLADGRFALLKQREAGYATLADTAFAWQHGEDYTIELRAEGARLDARVRDAEGREATLSVTDDDAPYLEGSIGLAVREGSHIACRHIDIRS